MNNYIKKIGYLFLFMYLLIGTTFAGRRGAYFHNATPKEIYLHFHITGNDFTERINSGRTYHYNRSRDLHGLDIIYPIQNKDLKDNWNTSFFLKTELRGRTIIMEENRCRDITIKLMKERGSTGTKNKSDNSDEQYRPKIYVGRFHR